MTETARQFYCIGSVAMLVFIVAFALWLAYSIANPGSGGSNAVTDRRLIDLWGEQTCAVYELNDMLSDCRVTDDQYRWAVEAIHRVNTADEVREVVRSLVVKF